MHALCSSHCLQPDHHRQNVFHTLNVKKQTVAHPVQKSKCCSSCAHLPNSSLIVSGPHATPPQFLITVVSIVINVFYGMVQQCKLLYYQYRFLNLNTKVSLKVLNGKEGLGKPS
jgi:hypothetical protein